MSRDKILQNIKMNNQGFNKTAYPVYHPIHRVQPSEYVETYGQFVKANRAKFIIVDHPDDIPGKVQDCFPNAKNVYSSLNGNLVPIDHDKIQEIDLAIIQGSYGVANNGATWVRDKDLFDRSIPFLCQYLTIVISADHLYADLYEAYQKIDPDDQSYGVFISGPSKTGDIEQALVIGAHGPLELLVVVVK